MKKEKYNQFVIIKNEGGNLKDFIKNFELEYKSLINENIILDFLSYNDLKINDLEEILNLLKSHKKSFVIVNSNIDIDQLSEEIAIAPSLEEAKDIIQMDEIARDLGF